MAISGPFWTTEGLLVTADAIAKTDATPEILELFLFSTDVTITAATVNVDLTEIITNGGEVVTLAKATWGAASGTDPVTSEYNTGTGIVFNITGALTIYGWAIRGSVTNKIYAAENFGVNTVGNGNTVTIYPVHLKYDIV